MAEVIRYVDPDAGGAGTGVDWTNAYTSLSAWEAAEQTDLVTDGNWHHCYVRASSGTADTATVQLIGWTTGAANYILIEAASGDEAVKTGWDATRYRLEVTDAIAFGTRADYTRVDGLQIRYIYSASAQNTIDLTALTASANDVRFSNCRIRGATTGEVNFAVTGSSTAIVTFWNCIFENSTADGLRLSVDTADFYNCIVYGMAYDAIEEDAGTITVKNSAVFNNGDDFQDVTTVDYCASDDNDGTNNVAETGGGASWTGDFNDAANGDFTLLTGSGLKNAGVDDPGSGLYSTDMDGDAYTSTWSVGVDEFVPGSVTVSGAATDGIVVGDVSSTFIRITGVSVDGITLSDSDSVFSRISAAATDGITLSDLSTVLATIVASAVDGVSLSDVTISGELAAGIISLTASVGAASITVTGNAASIAVTSKDPNITVS